MGRELRSPLASLAPHLASLAPSPKPKPNSNPTHRLGADDISDRNAALDIVTKSLATYAEKAYAINPNETDDDGTQSIATPPTMPTSNLKVDTMDAEFIFDEQVTRMWSEVTRMRRILLRIKYILN